MTAVVFMIGVQIALGAACIALIWSTRAERERHEQTRRDLAQMLAELVRIKRLHQPMPMHARPARFADVVGSALAIYESEMSQRDNSSNHTTH
jgi:hypothetical protein